MDHSTGHHHGCCQGEHSSRRGFLKLATLGAGVTLMAPMMMSRPAQAGSVDTLLLSCMDYRLMGHVAGYMNARNMQANYDHVILAGASLGALTDKKPAWGEAFWDHVAVAKELHHIKRVIVMDHRDCGAYRVFLGMDVASDPAKETEVHGQYLTKLKAMVKERHPDLEVELLLMGLDGTVEKLAA
ncbi:twin-arginine translocation signal domain-containing protein [Azospirillum sp. B21]|uniref:carbonic anhydrase n=1 Tax=Azospirillum sp. B21 TaxID=2607496 RepID=UPI0011EC0858|nr:carbonic anhydrase [Azospirillum sp. B21]KAA0574923.1 twin-arginine translocation signal domain-containing protein [Azospirillum sp. B21]